MLVLPKGVYRNALHVIIASRLFCRIDQVLVLL